MSRKRLFSVIFGLLTLGMTAFIFYNSFQTGVESGEASGFVASVAKKFLSFLGIEPNPQALEHFIRKAGHFTEYFILAVFTALFIIKSFCNKYLPALAAAYCFAVALCDEFIVQMNTIGRGPSFKDVMIDTCGALTALAIMFIIITLVKRKKAKNNG